VSEEQFWQRYFAAVERVRRHLLEESSEMTTSSGGGTGEGGDNTLSRTTSNVSKEANDLNEVGRLGSVSVNSKNLKHMANALETAKGFRRMEDMSEAGKPQGNSATKSSGGKLANLKLGNLRKAMEAGKQMLQRKVSGGGKQEKLVNAVWDLFDPDTDDGEWDIVKAYFPSTFRLTSQIGGAGPTTFLGHLVKHMCSFSTMSEMTTLWVQVLDEIRWHWKNMKPIPRIPKEQAPDLSCCTLHQKLMLLNNCIARKARFVARKKKPVEIIPSKAKLKDGSLCERKGHKTVLEGLKMIETGENIYIPETQEAPVLTEELMRETDEMIMKTGSVGPGLQQLLFDMQAFKAANPGCVLSDFVRWYSPSDWIEKDGKKSLSTRMMEPGNMWTELFDKATPIPALEQIPLFDTEYNGDMVVDALSEIAPSDLFEQLFIVAIVIRHAILEEIAISIKREELESKVMSGVTESEEFTVNTCCRGMSTSKIEKITNAYDTVDSFIMKCKPMEHLAEEDFDYEVNEWMVI
jgi:Rab3 GTPase-activating protein catalytic subunit